MRKVLLLVENAPLPGDPRVWNEALALRAAGYQVCVIAPKSPAHPCQEAYSFINGISIYRFSLPEAHSTSFAYFLEYACALWSITWLSLKVWHRHGFDVIHAANPPDILFLPALLYRCWGKKFVFDQHDLAPELCRVIFQKRVWLLSRFLNVLEYCSYRLADLVIVANESFLCRALERGGCTAAKVCVVRNGPNLEYFNLPGISSETLCFPKRRKYTLVYAGRMGRQDGVEYALYSLHHLIYKYRRRDVSAIFVGDGCTFSELHALAHNLELDAYVFFTGWLEMEDVLRYLAIADVGLVPEPQNGLNEYCTLLKVLEYMAMGIPMIAFDLAETRFSAQDAALYAKPNEVADFARLLAFLLDHEELRSTMGALGRKRVVEVLNWEQCSKNLLAAYEALFSDGKASDAELRKIRKNAQTIA
jgi:glycosyltransferase involved in cell wall biosynthesis